jgi:hypothetical protein
MGSDLYISIERQWPNGHWSHLFEGPSDGLDRGIVVNAFGEGPREKWEIQEIGEDPRTYVPPERWLAMRDHPECPWHLDEPYWVRLIDGKEFVDIIREKRWQKLQDGDFGDLECSPELRAYAALVESLLSEGVPVQVWAWHSQ